MGTFLSVPEVDVINLPIQSRKEKNKKNQKLPKSGQKILSKCSQLLNNKENQTVRLSWTNS